MPWEVLQSTRCPIQSAPTRIPIEAKIDFAPSGDLFADVFVSIEESAGKARPKGFALLAAPGTTAETTPAEVLLAMPEQLAPRVVRQGHTYLGHQAPLVLPHGPLAGLVGQEIVAFLLAEW